MNTVEKKRFVISKGMVGKEQVIQYTNKKGETNKYDDEAIYSMNQDKLETMECFTKYGNYTNSNNIPTWARECQVD